MAIILITLIEGGENGVKYLSNLISLREYSFWLISSETKTFKMAVHKTNVPKQDAHNYQEREIKRLHYKRLLREPLDSWGLIQF